MQIEHIFTRKVMHLESFFESEFLEFQKMGY